MPVNDHGEYSMNVKRMITTFEEVRRLAGQAGKRERMGAKSLRLCGIGKIVCQQSFPCKYSMAKSQEESPS